MNFIFLMDPLESVMMEHDTSFIFMLESHRRGYKVFFLPEGGITLLNGQPIFLVTEVIPQQVKDKPFLLKGQKRLEEKDVDAIFIRTDPPFDHRYLMQTWLLDRVSPRIPIINRPSGMRTVNEKIWATQFASIVPPTMVSCSRAELLKFIQEHDEIVAKPTDGFGGQSVFRIHRGDLNTNVILESLTHLYTRDIILQKFIPQAEKGDKRILLLNGEPLGAISRVHAPGDHRNNIFAGGKAVATEITSRDREIISILKPKLLEFGLYFVGIDIIGDYLIEVNVTSPTCVQEMNHLYRVQLEKQVINFVEKLIKDSRRI
ncbi:MAG: glutathione synthase [Candidatus Omnitrophica bacterium]|nr:glutathione synthase [Candidatus Omnitrophota bacterium]